MDVCVIDNVPETYEVPSREAIDQAREKQLNTLRQIRRLLTQVTTVQARYVA